MHLKPVRVYAKISGMIEAIWSDEKCASICLLIKWMATSPL